MSSLNGTSHNLSSLLEIMHVISEVIPKLVRSHCCHGCYGFIVKFFCNCMESFLLHCQDYQYLPFFLSFWRFSVFLDCSVIQYRLVRMWKFFRCFDSVVLMYGVCLPFRRLSGSHHGECVTGAHVPFILSHNSFVGLTKVSIAESSASAESAGWFYKLIGFL